MKKIVIIGASGSLASYVINALKPLKDVQLTLFVRSKIRLQKGIAEGCAIIEGDAMDYRSAENAVSGQDIVYVKAMNKTGAKRIIAISSIGIYKTPLRPVLEPYKKLADVIESSGLDYTILRPDWFTDADEVDYAITHKGEPERGTAISRKSIAAFIATIVDNPALHKNENLGISKPK